MSLCLSLSLLFTVFAVFISSFCTQRPSNQSFPVPSSRHSLCSRHLRPTRGAKGKRHLCIARASIPPFTEVNLWAVVRANTTGRRLTRVARQRRDLARRLKTCNAREALQPLQHGLRPASGRENPTREDLPELLSQGLRPKQ